MRPLLTAVALALIGGCGDEALAGEWIVELAEGPARDAVLLEVYVQRGGCEGGERLYAELIGMDGSAPRPPALGPGSYGFGAVARDAECAEVGRGCEAVELPRAPGDPVRVRVLAAEPRPLCEPSECVGGRCASGSVDAGARDAGPPDGEDAGPAIDAGEVDAGGDDPCAGAARVCTDGVERRCSPGMVEEVACDLGACSTTTPSRCARMAPSNVSDAMLDESAEVLAVDGDLAFECRDHMLARITSQPGGPDLCVLSLGGLDVRGNVAITGPNPVVLLVAGDCAISGTLDVSAASTRPGPGGEPGGTPDRPDGQGPGGGAPPSSILSGGGGGGMCAPGGDGGDGDTGIGGGGGSAIGTDWELEPLLGGSGGAGTPSSRDVGTSGGAGGGAIQISCTGTLSISGRVLAGGGGGRQNDHSGGGGGGSGGAILLEAPEIRLLDGAGLRAIGGGGGGGADGVVKGSNGQDGAAAEGGTAAGGSGPGGRGGGGGGEPMRGLRGGDDGTAAGGGGGGGAGCILLRTLAPVSAGPVSVPTRGPGVRVRELRLD